MTIRQSGSELVMSGSGRTFSTTECWEQYPGLSRVSHASSPRSWRNVCKTSPGDPRQATVITTITATNTQINFDETGQYQFVVQGQNCTASVRRTRVLTLQHREGDPEPAAAPSAAPVASAAPRPAPVEKRCAVTGLPERLEVRPSRKLMRPGESFTFRAGVVDRAGCALGLAPAWRVVTGGNAVELTGAGKVTVAENAPESEARLQASVGDRAVSVVVEIVSGERYDALLQQGSFNAEGESSEAAVARIATGSIGARSTVARDEAQGRKIAFVAIVGTLALALGVLGLFLVRRSRKQARAVQAELAAPAAKAGKGKANGKVCPTCREEYPADAEFCAFDGNRLLPFSGGAVGPAGGVCPVCGQGYDPGVTACPKHQEALVPALVFAERRRVTTVTQKICPVCGTQFPGDSQFCGKCGAALVPVN